MDYNLMLATVKKQNPDMPYKEQQQKAKGMYAEFKKAQAGYAKTSGSDAPNVSGVHEGSVPLPISALAMAEKRIRANVIDANSIVSLGREVIPEGKLINHGKDGASVNSLVSFEDEAGHKLPITGYFRIWI